MAPINDALLNVMATAAGAAATHLSLHSGVPNASGSNETSAGRVAAGWGAAANGDITATNKAFSGGASGGAVGYVGFWSAATGGTFYGYLPVTGDGTFNSAGEYTLNSVTINGGAA